MTYVHAYVCVRACVRASVLACVRAWESVRYSSVCSFSRSRVFNHARSRHNKQMFIKVYASFIINMVSSVLHKSTSSDIMAKYHSFKKPALLNRVKHTTAEWVLQLTTTRHRVPPESGCSSTGWLEFTTALESVIQSIPNRYVIIESNWRYPSDLYAEKDRTMYN